MLFFQVLLLGGYAYGHVCSRLSPQTQRKLHCAVLLASLVVCGLLAFVWQSPITPGTSWKPSSADDPVWRIVVVLGVSVGLPFLILSSTGPLLQAWLGRTHAGNSVYRLYALSNLGSLLALLSYPFLIEPWLSLKTQARLWSWGYVFFALGCGYCALQVREFSGQRVAPLQDGVGSSDRSTRAETPAPGKSLYAIWLSLAACASVMFLATTNQVCQDIAVIPLLWVLPLSVYLLSFVICFEKGSWYSRRWFHPAFGLAVFLACFVLFDGATGSIVAQVGIYSFVLFICCMVCHGELVRTRPSSRYLTSFYLAVASGGAVGGVFVALLAPHLFGGFWEYQIGLWGTALCVLLILMRDKESWLYRSRFDAPILVVGVASMLPGLISLTMRNKHAAYDSLGTVAVLFVVFLLTARKKTGLNPARAQAAPFCCGVALLILGAVLFASAGRQVQNSIALARSFYGVLALRLQNAADPNWEAYVLRNGRIGHGFQFRDQAKSNLPTAYYGLTSGVGVAILNHPRRFSSAGRPSDLRIGVVGLGIGTLAAYGRAGDYLRFYEINPDVIRLAKDPAYFTYLKECTAKVDLIPGDARLSLQNELEQKSAQQFDVLVIDAFTGDSIPIHLLTAEAFEIYLQHLRNPDGVIAIHITNRYLDLRPVISSAAEHFGLKSAWVGSSGDGRITMANDWMLTSKDSALLSSPVLLKASRTKNPHLPAFRMWTDDYSNLFQVLNDK